MLYDFQLPPELTEEEIIEYRNLAKDGDVVAKEKLKIHNLRLVIYLVCKKFSNTGLEISDLISIGTIGLLKAFDTFDINKNTKFVAYASKCINNEILDFIRKEKNIKKIIDYMIMLKFQKILRKI